MTNILTKAFCFTAVVVLMGLPCVHAVTITDNFSDLDDTSESDLDPSHGGRELDRPNVGAATGEYNITAPNNGIILCWQSVRFRR